MQRSRRALLQRRALGKASNGRYQLYKVSLSLAFILWGLVFLLSLWISRGDGHRDGSEARGLSTCTEPSAECQKNPNSPSKDSQKKCALFPVESWFVNAVDACGVSDKFWENEPETESTSSFEQPNVGSSQSVENPEHSSPNSDEPNLDNSQSVEKPEHSPPNSDQPNVDNSQSVEKPVHSSPNVDNSQSVEKPVHSSPNSDKLTHSVPLPLDEFKSKAFSAKSKSGNGQTGNKIHRMEPGGKEYNYASASKGAKVLAHNKEAKGVSNILGKDIDKYLRNPCSAEEKFVILELSEETLVSTVKIADFEHYSSKLKNFELRGSLVYPTDVWFSLGNFTANNVKHPQTFDLQEAKWVRYLKMNLLSHYGSEFYCTLSSVEVYGVDVVERMLEDLIAVQNTLLVPNEGTTDNMEISSAPAVGQNNVHKNLYEELEVGASRENVNGHADIQENHMSDPIEDPRQQQPGRLPGDSVLKILMQKVRSLDINLSVLERYLLEEMTSKYGKIFKDFDQDFKENDKLLEKIKLDIKSILSNQDAMAREFGYLMSWKSSVSAQLGTIVRENNDLRLKVERIDSSQTFMENKGIVIFVVCLCFGCLAIARLFLDLLSIIYTSLRPQSATVEDGEFCATSSSWLLLLSSCSLIIFVLSL